MMDVMLFGLGAAGNKAAIEVAERRSLAEERIKLINTTVKDIPDKYKNLNGSVITSDLALRHVIEKTDIPHRFFIDRWI